MQVQRVCTSIRSVVPVSEKRQQKSPTFRLKKLEYYEYYMDSRRFWNAQIFLRLLVRDEK
jgi:hypothetical protein